MRAVAKLSLAAQLCSLDGTQQAVRRFLLSGWHGGPGVLWTPGPLRQAACKPNSVRACALDGHSSRRALADALQQPTRKFPPARVSRPQRGPRWRAGPARTAASLDLAAIPFLFGLAPCGVYPAPDVTAGAVRSYRTFSPLPALGLAASRGRYFLCGTGRPRALTPGSRTLSGTLPFGVRTFLPRSEPAAAVRLLACSMVTRIGTPPAVLSRCRHNLESPCTTC